MNKLSSDYQYISQLNILGNHLQKRYGLNDKELQRLKNEVHELIRKAVENND